MKFYTKEWYELMQKLDYCVCMRPISDGEYSDDDIKKLYNKRLKAEIARDKRDYDEPPSFIDFDIDSADLDEFAYIDGTGVLCKPSSKAEIKEIIEAEKAAAWAEYENRPPFDPSETEQMFRQMYDARLEYGLMRFPEWARETVDPRLVALGYLPRSVYDSLKEECRRNKKQFEQINRAARNALKKENKKIPARITDIFAGFHDASILRLNKRDGDLEMCVRLNCACFEDETPYVRVVFKNAHVLESDGLVVDDCAKSSGAGSADATFADDMSVYLYDEFYAVDGGVEAHFLLCADDLKYLTVRCADIVCERNVDDAE